MRVELLNWEQAEAFAAPLRFAIFVEARQAGGLEIDEHDKESVHAVAFDEGGKAIATARMQPDGQIGRMAVVREWRRHGVGGEMLEALLKEAYRRGLAEVRLSAPLQALEFYRSQGFVADGKIEHVDGALRQTMRKSLS